MTAFAIHGQGQSEAVMSCNRRWFAYHSCSNDADQVKEAGT